MIRDLRMLLVIIAGNNVPTLPAVVQAAQAAGFDLLVIDDGSEGQDLATIADLPCRTLRLTKRRGYGAAVLAGAALAGQLGYDALVTMAGDGRHDPADIPLLVAEADRQGGPCLVVGDPRTPQPTTDFWIRLECGLEISDPLSSFRLYPVRELLALRPLQNGRSFAIESIVRLAWAGIPVVPVAVTVAAAEDDAGFVAKLKRTSDLALLHGRLVVRRLLPLPHLRFVPEESLHKKVVDTIWQNPFRVLGKACGEHTSPLWLAMAIWLGIFLGALPLLSIHTITIIYVAHRLHVNKVVAVAASQLCMPPVVPVLCIQVGYYLRKGELLLDFSWQRWLLEVHERFWEWLIGSLLLGPLLGLVGAAIMYWIAATVRTEGKKLKTENGNKPE